MASIPIQSSNRSFGLSGAGKGDKDRSPGWRDKYDEVFAHPHGRLFNILMEGFEQVSHNKFRKKYK